MLNSIGLANVGLDRFLNEKVPLLKKMPCPVIVNVAGHSFDDYTETCAAMNDLDCVAGVELNVSCPNVKDGLTFGTHPGRLKELTAQVKKVLANKPLIVKLSPNVEDVTLTARATIVTVVFLAAIRRVSDITAPPAARPSPLMGSIEAVGSEIMLC